MRRTHLVLLIGASVVLVAGGCSSSKNATVPGWSWSSLNPFSSKRQHEPAPPYPVRPSELAQPAVPQGSPAGYATVSSPTSPSTQYGVAGSSIGPGSPQTSLGTAAVTNRTASGFASAATRQINPSWNAATGQRSGLAQQGRYDAGSYGSSLPTQIASRNGPRQGSSTASVGTTAQGLNTLGQVRGWGTPGTDATGNNAADLYRRAVSGSQNGLAAASGQNTSVATGNVYPQAGQTGYGSLTSYSGSTGPTYPTAGAGSSSQQWPNRSTGQRVTQAGWNLPAGFGAMGARSTGSGDEQSSATSNSTPDSRGSSSGGSAGALQTTLSGARFAQAGSLVPNRTAGNNATGNPSRGGSPNTNQTWNPGGPTPNMPGNVNYNPGQTGYPRCGTVPVAGRHLPVTNR